VGAGGVLTVRAVRGGVGVGEFSSGAKTIDLSATDRGSVSLTGTDLAWVREIEVAYERGGGGALTARVAVACDVDG
jgi:hypothetical protein